MNTLLVLLGPTAVGKTDLALALAQQLGTDILSADSRQIYQDIPIGTAAPTPEQQALVRHHFVQILPLETYYSAAMYEADVLAQLSRTSSPTALLCGGSMLYIDAVCRGMDNIPTIRTDLRLALKERLAKEGLPALFAQLQALDPAYASCCDPQNPRRVLHALEVCLQSGRPFSSFRQRATAQRPFRILKVGLNRPRPSLFERINKRVDQMMADGLMDEAQSVYPKRHLNALNTVGYKELFKVIDGEWPLQMAVERIKKNTRVYAKKQLTWFLRDPDIHWLDLDQLTPAQVLSQVGALLSRSDSPVEG